MIAVLMSSIKSGSSSWAAVRGRKKVHVQGMKGDLIRLHFHHTSDRKTWMELEEDFIADIPLTCIRIKVEHIETSGNPVFVDLR